MKRILVCALVLALCLLCGCGGSAESGSASSVTEIVLNGDSIEVKGGGAKAAGNVVTISAVGSYSVSGTLNDGQIVVNTGDEAMEVTLILNNASITNLSGPAIHVVQAKDINIELAAGSENTVVSGKEAAFGDADENASGAAIYAEDDMDIDGEADAKLNVFGYINNGIACKNDLDIQGGCINVYAVNNGVRGNDSFEMKGGELSVRAGNDGIKSTTADKEGKGYISIEGGSLAVEAMGDGLSAETSLSVLGGSVSVITAGDPNLASSKGIKANSALSIDGGSVSVKSTDHALHCEGGISINGGEISLSATQGKGISSESDIGINGGAVLVNSAEDGIETLGNVSIGGGDVIVYSGKDGVQTGEANSGKGDLSIMGGSLAVNAYKEGFNVRGALNYEGGFALALCGENKLDNPQHYSAWTGSKGGMFSIKLEGKEIAGINTEYAYKHVVFFTNDSGLFALSDGIRSLDLN